MSFRSVALALSALALAACAAPKGPSEIDFLADSCSTAVDQESRHYYCTQLEQKRWETDREDERRRRAAAAMSKALGDMSKSLKTQPAPVYKPAYQPYRANPVWVGR